MISEHASFPEVIDNSMRSLWVSCETKTYYSFMRRIAAHSKGTALIAGGAFAKGMEAVRRAYYEFGHPADAAIAIGIKELLLAYGEHEPLESSSAKYRTAENCVRALIDYWDSYGFEHAIPWSYGDGKHAIEFRFAIPLPYRHPVTGNPLIAGGRADVISEIRELGSLWVQDEKTTYSVNGIWAKQWTLDSQPVMYTWAARESGFDVAGAVISGVGIMAGRTELKTVPVDVSESVVARWYNQFCIDVEQMLEAWERRRFSQALDKHVCGAFGGCEYELLCSVEEPEQWIPIHYIPRTWNPLDLNK